VIGKNGEVLFDSQRPQRAVAPMEEGDWEELSILDEKNTWRRA
jgi:hypothetical protein